MLGLGPPEIAIILVVGFFFFFGKDKVGEIGKTLGKFTGEFKKGKEEMERELKNAEKEFKKSI